MTSSAVVAVGDELLDGTVVDSNAAWLGRRLAAIGAPVIWAVRVGDDVGAIRDAVSEAAKRAPVVVVSGGLGPTADDVTREALAAAAGVPLERDSALVALLERWYAGHGRTVPAEGLRQADVPRGASALPNPAGSAPALRLGLGSATVWAVPGVPRELKATVEAHVLPSLEPAGTPVVTRTLYTAMAGETVVAAALSPLAAQLPPEVRLGYLAAPGEVRVRLSTSGSADQLEPFLAAARELLGDLVVGEERLEAVVYRLLLSRGATVAAAESLTGGLVGAALTTVAGSSAIFLGAVVAYASSLKSQLLGVDERLLAAEGAVHPQVAEEMALGVQQALGATYGVATTGVAGPEPQDGCPVGTVYVAVAGPSGTEVASPSLAFGDRDTIRRVAVVAALDLLRRELLR